MAAEKLAAVTRSFRLLMVSAPMKSPLKRGGIDFIGMDDTIAAEISWEQKRGGWRSFSPGGCHPHALETRGKHRGVSDGRRTGRTILHRE
jgi:hypothetical protein